MAQGLPGWGAVGGSLPLPTIKYKGRATFFFFLSFLELYPRHMAVPRLGVNGSYSRWPTP